MAQASLIMSAASSLASAGLQETQAGIEKDQAEIAARQEELAVTQREADRKDRLANALASQNAMSGARGIAAFEGSPLTVLQDSIERERVATERDKFMGELNALALRSGGKVKRRLSRVQTHLGLMQTGKSLMGTGM